MKCGFTLFVLALLSVLVSQASAWTLDQPRTYAYWSDVVGGGRGYDTLSYYGRYNQPWNRGYGGYYGAYSRALEPLHNRVWGGTSYDRNYLNYNYYDDYSYNYRSNYYNDRSYYPYRKDWWDSPSGSAFGGYNNYYGGGGYYGPGYYNGYYNNRYYNNGYGRGYGGYGGYGYGGYGGYGYGGYGGYGGGYGGYGAYGGGYRRDPYWRRDWWESPY